VPRFRACIGLGGNLGDVLAHLRAALAGLSALPGTALEGVSSLYQTQPVEATGPDYLNAVAVVQTALGPRELLGALHALEARRDRERPYQNAPRTLDLDLLCHGDAVRQTPFVTVPHPRMGARAFVLEPLVEVLNTLAPDPFSPLPRLPDAAARATLAREQGIVRLSESL
jgi:2-amino-4-hydroxy-6-hydroxymethyldihydropteridine diphosphokinase